MTEDAAEEFQKVQDICHAKILHSTLKRLSQETSDPSKRNYLALPNELMTKAEQVRDR